MKIIDLFCGAGGMSEGFRMAGAHALFANDFEGPALKTYLKNHPGVDCSGEPIETIDASALRKQLGLKSGQLDVLLGGPPCQGFSTYGQRSMSDLRNQLYQHFIRFLDEFKPRAFVMENVVGILSMADGAIVVDILERTAALGYAVNLVTLDAVEFGVPQKRKRVFFLGQKGKKAVGTPRGRHLLQKKSVKSAQDDFFPDNGHLLPIRTVKDAIGDLPSAVLLPKQTQLSVEYQSLPQSEYQIWVRNGCTQLFHHSSKQMLGIRRLRLALMHPGDYGLDLEDRLTQNGLPYDVIDKLLYGAETRDINECRKEDREKELQLKELLHRGHTSISEIFELIDSGGFANKYRRLKWDAPSHTLVAHMARDCSDFVHPSIDRFISVREAARLQSFRDDYTFVGSQFHQFKQIGNAVPPLLGYGVATAIAKAIGFEVVEQKVRA